jgi:hypothetical protein
MNKTANEGETTMASEKKTWTETNKDRMADVGGRAIWVSDGVVGHYRSLEDEYEDMEKVLDDYAGGYKCNSQEITVDWYLFDDGDEVQSGRYTFNVE